MASSSKDEDLLPEQTEGFKVGEKKTIDEYHKLGMWYLLSKLLFVEFISLVAVSIPMIFCFHSLMTYFLVLGKIDIMSGAIVWFSRINQSFEIAAFVPRIQCPFHIVGGIIKAQKLKSSLSPFSVSIHSRQHCYHYKSYILKHQHCTIEFFPIKNEHCRSTFIQQLMFYYHSISQLPGIYFLRKSNPNTPSRCRRRSHAKIQAIPRSRRRRQRPLRPQRPSTLHHPLPNYGL